MEVHSYHVFLLIACVFMSAFFSAAETALTSLSIARTRQLIEEKSRNSRVLSLWLKRPNHVLTAILVGNNVVNTLAAAMATVLAQSVFQNFAVSIATFGITLLLLIFGEITPKTFARHNAERFAPIAMLLLMPYYAISLPVVLALSWLASKIVLLVGGRSSSTGPVATEEDIAYLIRLGHEEGVLKRTEGQMLQSVIEFRDTVVKEAMVPRTEICSFEVSMPLHMITQQIKDKGHTRWPVYQQSIDNVIGIFHAKDLLGIVQNPPTNFHLKDYIRPAKFVPDRMKISSLLKEFQAGKAHLAIVVDEYGGTAGVISLEDVLEEIVGEIRDEYDDEERERTFQKIDENNYIVDGRANIFEVGKVLDVAFPESDAYDSVGGFLIATYGRMPEVGSKIIFNQCTFVIKTADEKRVKSVHIHRVAMVAAFPSLATTENQVS